jgi:hypothetical protein
VEYVAEMMLAEKAVNQLMIDNGAPYERRCGGNVIDRAAAQIVDDDHVVTQC